MLVQFFETKLALGSDVTIVLVMNKQRDPTQLFSKIWRKVFGFERQFSRFLPSSELSMFNRNAGMKQFVSPEFHKLLTASKAMAKTSDNLYNPFILPVLQRSGYKHSSVPGYERDKVDDHSNKQVVNPGRLVLEENHATIPYGTAIDMGGCGKGYLADELADMLDDEQLDGYWISLGGDMVVSGTDELGHPWTITIQSAVPDRGVAPVVIANSGQRMAIATSGTFRRQNQNIEKKNWHHLIDPRTFKPADTDIKLSTVVDNSALRADVLASCAAIVGSGEAKQYLQARKIMDAVIQHEGAKGSIQLICFGGRIHESEREVVHA